MAEVKTLTVNDVTYDIKDATSRRVSSQNTANISSLTGRVSTLENANFLPSAKIQFVQSLPVSPDNSTFYFIPEGQ